jgi:hypothetical protein
MKNPRDHDVGGTPVVDDVVLDNERPNAGPELRSWAPDGRLFGEEVTSLDDRVDEPVGRRRAGVLGDVRARCPRGSARRGGDNR